MNLFFEDLGVIDYKEAWDYQEKLFNELITNKISEQNNSNSPKIKRHYLLFCEHQHVYTLGKNGNVSNLLISDEILKKIDAKFYKINRGGDITYHGPGQIVGYPIFDLEALNIGIKEYIYLLENCIIEMLAIYGINAGRLNGATGVWLDRNSVNARKICSIGVRASRYVTMHGFALNVNTNLDYFRYINPCGFIDKSVTSMEKELGRRQNINEIKKNLLEIVIRYFEKNK